MQKGYLILQNGSVFEGEMFGAPTEALGELVFTTGMTGYLETLTDPSYYGQIVMQTFPLIGNYGVIPQDFESPTPRLKGYIVREWCQEPSNFRCQGTLDTFLKEKGIPALCGIDTRAVTRMVRESGVMNAWISLSPVLTEEMLKSMESYRVENAVASVTVKSEKDYTVDNPRFRVALMDLGAKGNIHRVLQNRGCTVEIIPATATAEEILALKPDGIMLSNGPGDPRENAFVIAQTAKLCASGVPMFGICLGHQIIALAQGAETVKLKYGHRGTNQPVEDTVTGRIYITSQNHGYAVKSVTLPVGATVRFKNVNDGTCEGVDYSGIPVFSVQFHPEASAGPLDTGFLFDKFVTMMEEK